MSDEVYAEPQVSMTNIITSARDWFCRCLWQYISPGFLYFRCQSVAASKTSSTARAFTPPQSRCQYY